MKRILTAMMALTMLFAFAAAEEKASLSFGVYAQTFSEMTEAVWEADGAEVIQMLVLSDDVTVSACLLEDCVMSVSAEFPCGEMPEKVYAAIANLGWLSGEGLAQLTSLGEGATAEIEECMVYFIHGESRDAVSICRTADAEGMLWQPIHGGKKIHDTPRCSGMDVSRMITDEAAALTGWEDCGTCRADVSAEAENQ